MLKILVHSVYSVWLEVLYIVEEQLLVARSYMQSPVACGSHDTLQTKLNAIGVQEQFYASVSSQLSNCFQ